MINKWRNLETDQRIMIFKNICVGVFVVILFHFLATREWGENIVNLAFDSVQYREAKLASSVVPDTPIRFIDITTKSYEAWGKPLLTPRHVIAELIEHARKNGAKVIVLDILLDRDDCCKPEGDLILRETIQNIATSPSAPYLVIPVKTSRNGSLQSTIVDDIIDSQPIDRRKVFRGIPLLSASSRDQRARYWEFYRYTTTTDGRKQVLWGVPVLAATLYAGHPEILTNIEQSLLDLGKEPPQLSLGNSHYRLSRGDIPPPPDLYSQRIRYTLLPSTVSGLMSNLLTIRRTADLIIGKDFSNEVMTGKIVIIGNSYEESGDLHETPVGSMPGMYVIGNAIHTLAANVQPVPLGNVPIIILEILAVCAMAFLMGKEIPFYYILPLFLVALPLLANEITWQLYRSFGIFFNFTVPLIVMAIYRTSSKLVKSFSKKEKPSKEEISKDEDAII